MMTEPSARIRKGDRVVTGVGNTDPLGLLLRDPALVLAAEPCLVHRRRLELRIAALKCLGRADFLRFGNPGRRERLYGRLRWALPDEAARWWDRELSLPHPAWTFEPAPAEFDSLKVRANRLAILGRGLDNALAGLPDAFADALLLEPACGSDEGLLRLHSRRVAKPGAAIAAPWLDRGRVPGSPVHEPLFIWSS